MAQKAVIPTQAKRSAKLPTGLTIKQETFARLVAEGNNYAQAYRMAYDVDPKSPSQYGSASQIANKPHIAKRIAELQEEMLEEYSAQAKTRAIRVVATLETMMRSAKSDAARIRAAELLGKSVALFDPIDPDNGVDATTLADLERRLGELLGRKR